MTWVNNKAFKALPIYKMQGKKGLHYLPNTVSSIVEVHVVLLLAACAGRSMHAGVQHPCLLYMTSHTIHTITSCTTGRDFYSRQERLLCKRAVAKVWLLFETAFVQEFTVIAINGGDNVTLEQSQIMYKKHITRGKVCIIKAV